MRQRTITRGRPWLLALWISLALQGQADHPGGWAPKKGDWYNLVIFIRFADQTEFSETISSYDNLFNRQFQPSLKHYFNEVSANQCDIDSLFFPDNDNGFYPVSYQHIWPRSHYLPYHLTQNPDGYTSTEIITREFELLTSAVAYVENDIAMGLDIDFNNDFQVDNICFVIKGESEGDILTPHHWVLTNTPVSTINSFFVYDYNLITSSNLNLGLLSRLTFQSMAGSDLRTPGAPVSPVGPWDLMGQDHTMPVHPLVWQKYRYGNWLNTLPNITTDGTYSLAPVTSSSFSCYKIAGLQHAEFFMLEYRRASGYYDGGLPNNGLLIYRVDTDVSGHEKAPPYEIYMFRPGSDATTNGLLTNAVFSLDSGRTKFNAVSDPTPRFGNGQRAAVHIYDIGTALSGSISFKVSFSDIFVDHTWGGTEQGTLYEPYNTVKEGATAAVNGQTLFIRGGSYSGTGNIPVTFTNCRVRTYEGATTIGF